MSTNAGLDDRFRVIVKSMISRLVQGRYEDLERDTQGKRISAAEMKAAIDDCGAILTMTPDDILANLDVVRVSTSDRQEWSVYCPLWTEGGATDLTMELTIYQNEAGSMRAEIDGIHTL
jgi:hypothetical protein